jgi:hypothetical protein
MVYTAPMAHPPRQTNLAKPRSVYIEDHLWDAAANHARERSFRESEPVSTAMVVREALREYLRTKGVKLGEPASLGHDSSRVVTTRGEETREDQNRGEPLADELAALKETRAALIKRYGINHSDVQEITEKIKKLSK